MRMLGMPPHPDGVRRNQMTNKSAAIHGYFFDRKGMGHNRNEALEMHDSDQHSALLSQPVAPNIPAFVHFQRFNSCDR
jgi:hypothetical protein